MRWWLATWIWCWVKTFGVSFLKQGLRLVLKLFRKSTQHNVHRITSGHYMVLTTTGDLPYPTCSETCHCIKARGEPMRGIPCVLFTVQRQWLMRPPAYPWCCCIFVVISIRHVCWLNHNIEEKWESSSRRTLTCPLDRCDLPVQWPALFAHGLNPTLPRFRIGSEVKFKPNY